MGDFFRDALKQSTQIIGSYDEYNRCYELTIIGQGFDGNEDTNTETAGDGYLTLSFDDRSNGWTSFKGFKQEGGISLNNYYYTFNGGTLWEHHTENVTHNNFYNSGTQKSYVVPIFNDAPSLIKQYNALSYEGDEGWGVEYIQTDIGNSGIVLKQPLLFLQHYNYQVLQIILFLTALIQQLQKKTKVFLGLYLLNL
jgi:hypothetical protein